MEKALSGLWSLSSTIVGAAADGILRANKASGEEEEEDVGVGVAPPPGLAEEGVEEDSALLSALGEGMEDDVEFLRRFRRLVRRRRLGLEDGEDEVEGEGKDDEEEHEEVSVCVCVVCGCVCHSMAYSSTPLSPFDVCERMNRPQHDPKKDLFRDDAQRIVDPSTGGGTGQLQGGGDSSSSSTTAEAWVYDGGAGGEGGFEGDSSEGGGALVGGGGGVVPMDSNGA